MKMMTFNLHSLVDVKGISLDWNERFSVIANKILEERYDVIALQEVNQPIAEQAVAPEALRNVGYISAGDDEIIRQGNVAYTLASYLKENDVAYRWSFCIAHLGYGSFEEGTAIFSRLPAERAFALDVSREEEKGKWTYRRLIGLELLQNQEKMLFLSVHFGWWKGKEESEGFLSQWKRMNRQLDSLKATTVFIMGDFNNTDTVREEGYDLVTKLYGFSDSYLLANQKPDRQEAATTLTATIDGWEGNQCEAKRLDYIMINRKLEVSDYRNVFDGKNGSIVSDHFGVEINIHFQSTC